MAKKNRSRRMPSVQRTSASATITAQTQADPVEQYRYVLDDLRRVGIIAAILVGALIALSFLIK